jgi:hypothetical protein
MLDIGASKVFGPMIAAEKARGSFSQLAALSKPGSAYIRNGCASALLVLISLLSSLLFAPQPIVLLSADTLHLPDFAFRGKAKRAPGNCSTPQFL